MTSGWVSKAVLTRPMTSETTLKFNAPTTASIRPNRKVILLLRFLPSMFTPFLISITAQIKGTKREMTNRTMISRDRKRKIRPITGEFDNILNPIRRKNRKNGTPIKSSGISRPVRG